MTLREKLPQTSLVVAVAMAGLLNSYFAVQSNAVALSSATPPGAKSSIDQLREERRRFQGEELITAGPNTWIFNPGDPPRIVWRDVEEVRKLRFKGPLRVRWFNARLEEAAIPNEPGLFRIVVPLNGTPSVGWIVFGISLAYLAFEALMLRVVVRRLETQRPLSRWLSAVHGASECLYPIVTLCSLMLLVPEDRYTLLVSPGYGFLLVLIAVSVLRADWQATTLTGAVATLGYAGLVMFGLLGSKSGTVNPHPAALYANLTLMLGIATAASAFVARQVRSYVLAAVREMEIRKQRDRLKHDLDVAKRIQESLLPGSMPDFAGYEFAAVSRPADETGGDYYDWQEIGPQRAVFSLGDVTGHGIGPALVTAACRAYVRAILGKESPPAAVLRLVNTLLVADLPDGRFVTLALVDLNAETHQVRLLSAGHGPTLFVRGRDGEVREIDSQGLALGLCEDGMLEDDVQFSLGPGDLVVLCSDGFFEPANSAGQEFGIDRLAGVLRTNRHESASRLVELMENEVREFVGDMPQPDDMTALIIKRNK